MEQVRRARENQSNDALHGIEGDGCLIGSERGMENGLTVGGDQRPNLPPDVKCPTRIICYAWGAKYVDILLSLTLPSLLAPGNLPFVATEVPCMVVVLTERRFFAKLNSHPVIIEIRKHCPVRLIRLDDLIVSKDKYGMSLTYALHRGFCDLGLEMTKQWQIFLNADFILADGALRNVIVQLSRGARIVASPSYCVNADEAVPELHKWLTPSDLALRIPHRELARIILTHRHAVIRGKTINQQRFHMRYMDQFYWEVDDNTLIGFQMPIAIIGLHPERYVAEPSSYWDYGLIREYCPNADVRVLGDSDQCTVLELRDRSVAEDQAVPGPPNLAEIAQRMIVWVTPYQLHFLQFPLTLHARDLPANTQDARRNLKTFIEQVVAHAPTFPSHLDHPQWTYHWAGFIMQRRKSYKFRSWIVARVIRPSRAATKRGVVSILRPIGLGLVIPIFRRLGLEVVKAQDAFHLRNRVVQLTEELSELTADLSARGARVTELMADLSARGARVTELTADLSARDARVSELTARITDLENIATEYQYKLERKPDYQTIMAQDQIRHGLSNLEFEFLALYENCRQYSMTSWERLYAVYKSVRYIVENEIPGDLVECGVWRGGSMKLAAHVLLSLGVEDRTLFLYDTFEGMTEPDPTVDVDFSGNNAINDWTEVQRRSVKWAYASLEEVRETMARTGYPMDRINLVKGPVEQTIPKTMPNKIALLRLDTDWYASTRHELEHLYPLLSPEGVLILDDYGHYRGAARAVDEYVAKLPKKPMLHRVDYSSRAATKPNS
jgi:hypothetical protein